MNKWADYCISKATYDSSSKRFIDFFVRTDTGNSLTDGQLCDRNWVVQKLISGYSFCTVEPSQENGNWKKLTDVSFNNGGVQLNTSLPDAITKRKTFISYYHQDDQTYKEQFENRFADLIVPKSVKAGDINADNSTEYIKQLIQKDFLSDTTVLVVLVGGKTKCRKHVDWEISGALNKRVGQAYAGLVGILLPSHPDYGKNVCNEGHLPARLFDNVNSGYAKLYDWTTDRIKMQRWIEEAYHARKQREDLRVNSRIQMQRNTCN